MSRIIQILIKNHVFFLFFFLEFISLKIFISNNFVAESNFSKKMTEIRSDFFLKEKSIKDYFLLKNQNTELLKANTYLLKKNLYLNQCLEFTQNLILNQEKIDSNFVLQAKVLRNSWNKKQNFITINRGEINGLKRNMGVINNNNSLIGISF